MCPYLLLIHKSVCIPSRFNYKLLDFCNFCNFYFVIIFCRAYFCNVIEFYINYCDLFVHRIFLARFCCEYGYIYCRLQSGEQFAKKANSQHQCLLTEKDTSLLLMNTKYSFSWISKVTT